MKSSIQPATPLAAICLALFLPSSPALGAPAAPAAQQESQALVSAPGAQDAVTIPGPLTAFMRIAAISRKISPEEVLPFLARNIVIDGYHNAGDKNRKPTEFLKLLQGYLAQARELQGLADSQGWIRVNNCGDVEPLLRVIGYRLRGPCSSDVAVETDEPRRAFLTVDSGFPLVDLEEALQKGRPFEHHFDISTLPVLFTQKDWAWHDANLVDAILADPTLGRLYWAMSRIDSETREVLRRSPGLEQLVPFAPLLDFYGSHLAVRSGRVVVPGGPAGEAAWRSLVGASPDSPAEFLIKLLEKDEGWLIAYFDALSYVPRSQQAYFTDANRLKRFYEAVRGKDLSPSPARSVFRPTANLYLLTSRLFLDADGRPHVPGNLEIWKEIFRRKSDSRAVRDLAKGSSRWNQPEHLLEALFALSRVPAVDGPLQVYLQLIEIDRRRPGQQFLSPPTVRLMAEKFSRFRQQYLVFSEFSTLDDTSITRFLAATDAIDHIGDSLVRANALGLFQANLGLWQILARQDQIHRENRSASWQRVMYPFSAIKESEQLFDAARQALEEVMRAAGVAPPLTQAKIIALLAGPSQSDPASQRMQAEVADRIRTALDSQRLVTLDALFELGDGLTQMAEGRAMSDSLMRLAGMLREFELPQPMFTRRERSEWASGLQHNPHTSLQTRTDISKVLAEPSKKPEDLTAARGMLTPFLRDTLVGLNYAYYEPPGAQMIRNNPLFVRSHNFSGQMTMKGDEVWQTPRVLGRGWSASGGAHLAGSISDLPYVLAQIEQDFIVPENVQSLIWADLVPTILTSAVVPRWWRVTPNELRAVALYQQLGEDLVAAAANDSAVQQKVLDELWDYMLPQRLGRFEQSLRAGGAQDAQSLLTPSELFALGTAFFEHDAGRAAASGQAGRELSELAGQYPGEVSRERISRDFGVPHPMLAQTYARELLAGKPLPTFLGYSSRLLAESWESSNLYWARLAVEKGYHPSALHTVVPALTHRMVERIFATHLEDWPAVLRALRETGEEFRVGRIASLPHMDTAGGL